MSQYLSHNIIDEKGTLDSRNAQLERVVSRDLSMCHVIELFTSVSDMITSCLRHVKETSPLAKTGRFVRPKMRKLTLQPMEKLISQVKQDS